MNLEDIKEKNMVWWDDYCRLAHGVVIKETQMFYIFDTAHTTWGVNRKLKHLCYSDRSACVSQLKKDSIQNVKNANRHLQYVLDIENSDYTKDLAKEQKL